MTPLEGALNLTYAVGETLLTRLASRRHLLPALRHEAGSHDGRPCMSASCLLSCVRELNGHGQILASGHSRIPVHLPGNPTDFIGMLSASRASSSRLFHLANSEHRCFHSRQEGSLACDRPLLRSSLIYLVIRRRSSSPTTPKTRSASSIQFFAYPSPQQLTVSLTQANRRLCSLSLARNWTRLHLPRRPQLLPARPLAHPPRLYGALPWLVLAMQSS